MTAFLCKYSGLRVFLRHAIDGRELLMFFQLHGIIECFGKVLVVVETVRIVQINNLILLECGPPLDPASYSHQNYHNCRRYHYSQNYCQYFFVFLRLNYHLWIIWIFRIVIAVIVIVIVSIIPIGRVIFLTFWSIGIPCTYFFHSQNDNSPKLIRSQDLFVDTDECGVKVQSFRHHQLRVYDQWTCLKASYSHVLGLVPVFLTQKPSHIRLELINDTGEIFNRRIQFHLDLYFILSHTLMIYCEFERIILTWKTIVRVLSTGLAGWITNYATSTLLTLNSHEIIPVNAWFAHFRTFAQSAFRRAWLTVSVLQIKSVCARYTQICVGRWTLSAVCMLRAWITAAVYQNVAVGTSNAGLGRIAWCVGDTFESWSHAIPLETFFANDIVRLWALVAALLTWADTLIVFHNKSNLAFGTNSCWRTFHTLFLTDFTLPIIQILSFLTLHNTLVKLGKVTVETIPNTCSTILLGVDSKSRVTLDALTFIVTLKTALTARNTGSVQQSKTHGTLGTGIRGSWALNTLRIGACNAFLALQEVPREAG